MTLGPLSDPAVRQKRAKLARAAQSTTDYYIKKLVDAAPPLTPEQRDRLALLLRGGDAA